MTSSATTAHETHIFLPNQDTVSLHRPRHGSNILISLSQGLDKGGADLIADGRIKVRSGVHPEKFTERGIVLSDGSELSADALVFAYVSGGRGVMFYHAEI